MSTPISLLSRIDSPHHEWGDERHGTYITSEGMDPQGDSALGRWDRLFFIAGLIAEENFRDIAEHYHLNKLWIASGAIMSDLSPVLANRWTWLIFFALGGAMVTMLAGGMLSLDRTRACHQLADFSWGGHSRTVLGR